MTQRFYFDVANAQTTIRDEEGVEAEGLTEALEQAEAALNEMRASRDVPDREAGWQMIIRDESGNVVKILPIG